MLFPEDNRRHLAKIEVIGGEVDKDGRRIGKALGQVRDEARQLIVVQSEDGQALQLRDGLRKGSCQRIVLHGEGNEAGHEGCAAREGAIDGEVVRGEKGRIREDSEVGVGDGRIHQWSTHYANIKASAVLDCT